MNSKNALPSFLPAEPIPRDEKRVRPAVPAEQAEARGPAAVASFYSSLGELVVWIRLTGVENDSTRFWRLFVQAVALWAPELAGQMELDGFPGDSSAARYTGDLSQTVEKGEGVILVLENFQMLRREGPSGSFVQELIRAGIEGLSVVLVSGTEVRVALAGGAPFCQTDAQLRFTCEEIRVYYTALGILLSRRDLRRVWEVTEGWAFFIYLIGLHLVKNEPLLPRNVDSAVASVFGLLEQKVFSPLEKETQRALVLLSFLGEFTPEMAADLTGLEGEQLLGLMQSLPFLNFRPELGVYYFHNLAKEFLRLKQKGVGSKGKKKFLCRAGQWCEAHGQPVQAAGWYLQGQDYAGVARMIEGVGFRHMTREEARWVIAIVDQLPAEVTQAYPLVLVVSAYMLLNAGKVEEAELQLSALQARLEEKAKSLEAREALGEICVVQAFVRLRLADYGFVSLLRQASEYLPQSSRLVKKGGTQLVGNGSAMVYPGPGEGELRRMVEALFTAMPYTEQVLGGVGFGREHLAAAETYYYTGQVKKAEPFAYQAIAKALLQEQWDIICGSYYILMRIGMSRGRLEEAQGSLNKLRDYASRIEGSPFVLPDIAQAGLSLKIGDFSAVAPWILELDPDREEYVNLYAGRELVMKAGYLLGTRQYYEAVNFIDAGIRRCDLSGQRFSRLKLVLLKAIAYGRLEQWGVAAKNLQAAYEAAAPNRIIMPFVEYGNRMRSLITHTRGEKNHSLPGEWLDEIYTKSNTYAKYLAILKKEYEEAGQRKQGNTEKLTRREKDVLHLVCQGLTNEEIAKKEDLRVNTIKGMLTRIYPKIGAANRADAVRITIEEPWVLE